jgi:hypothetical protein
MVEPYGKINNLPNYQIIITKMSKSYKNTLQKRAPHCPHCQNLNLPANHWLRKTTDPMSELVCPVLLQTECQYCFELGHTVSHCKSIREYKEKRMEYKKKIVHIQNNNNTFAALIDDDDDDDYDVTIGASRLFALHSQAQRGEPLGGYVVPAESTAQQCVGERLNSVAFGTEAKEFDQGANVSKGFGRTPSTPYGNYGVKSLTTDFVYGSLQKRCTMMVNPKCSPLHSDANHLMGATCQPRTLVDENVDDAKLVEVFRLYSVGGSRRNMEECQQTSVHLNESETTDSLKIYTTHREHHEPFLFQRRILNWADDESDDE